MIRTPPAGTALPRPATETLDPGYRELLAIREIVHAFLVADRSDEVLQMALSRVSPLVGASFACIYVIEEGSELMRLAAACNWPERYAPFLDHVRVRLGFGPSGESASERRAIEVPDVFADPSLEDWQEVAAELGFRCLVSLPLQHGPLVLGAVTFYYAAAAAISTETRALLRMVAEQMGATAAKARVLTDLRRENEILKARVAELEGRG